MTKRKLQEQKLAIAEELRRRQTDDPLRLFEPHSKQRPFIDSVLRGEKKENWFLAANRAGKSDAGAVVGATLARFGDQSDDVKSVRAEGSTTSVRDRATSGWVVSLDFPASRDIIQPKYFNNGFLPAGATHEPFIPEREILEWRSGDQILKLKNGSLIGFKSAESGRMKFQGAEKDYVHFDEEPPRSIYEESVIRVGARVLRVFGTCTLLPPEGMIGGVTWVFTDIVKKWQKGELDYVGIFTSSIYDNPYVPRTEIERLEAIYPEGSAQRRIRLNGELIPGLSGARVYAGFDHRLNVKSQPEINTRMPLCWTWDFNIEPLVSLIGQREGKLFRIHRELIMEEGHIGDMCDWFRQVFPVHNAEIWVFGDATGGARSTHTKMTSYQVIMNHMAQYNVPIKLRVPESNPSVPARINAMNRAFRNEDGRVLIEIDPTCVELIADLEGVVSDGRGGIKKTHNKKDSYFRRTHTSDATGYWVSQEEPVRQMTEERTPRPGRQLPSVSYSNRKFGTQTIMGPPR